MVDAVVVPSPEGADAPQPSGGVANTAGGAAGKNAAGHPLWQENIPPCRSEMLPVSEKAFTSGFYVQFELKHKKRLSSRQH